MGKIGIKLESNIFTPSCAKVLRAYRDISISEIKELVQNNDYLLTCDYIDANGIVTILKLSDDLTANKLLHQIYEHDVVTNKDFLNNLLESYAETARQVEIDMDNEALAFEEE